MRRRHWGIGAARGRVVLTCVHRQEQNVAYKRERRVSDGKDRVYARIWINAASLKNHAVVSADTRKVLATHDPSADRHAAKA